MQTRVAMRKRLIQSGVWSLTQIGCEGVTAENILTNETFSDYFRAFLLKQESKSKVVSDIIKSLLADIAKTND